MRSLIALLLLSAVLLEGCASAAASFPDRPPATPAAPPTSANFKVINEDLEGEVATVELADGEVVHDAAAVTLGPETTTWREAAGTQRTVPTARVRRVLREQKGLMGRAFAYGMAAAALPAYLLLQNLDRHEGNGGLAIYLTVPLAGVGGLFGMAIAAARRHPVVVYAAPAAPGGAPGGAAALNLHCHLAMSSAGALLDCAPR